GPGQLLDLACRWNLADAEVGDAQPQRAVALSLGEDVGRLQVAMHQRRPELMRERYRVEQLQQPARHRLCRWYPALMHLADQAAKIATLYKLVFQTKRIVIEINLAQLDNARMPALLAHSIERLGLVPQRFGCFIIQAKLEGSGEAG